MALTLLCFLIGQTGIYIYIYIYISILPLFAYSKLYGLSSWIFDCLSLFTFTKSIDYLPSPSNNSFLKGILIEEINIFWLTVKSIIYSFVRPLLLAILFSYSRSTSLVGSINSTIWWFSSTPFHHIGLQLFHFLLLSTNTFWRP